MRGIFVYISGVQLALNNFILEWDSDDPVLDGALASSWERGGGSTILQVFNGCFRRQLIESILIIYFGFRPLLFPSFFLIVFLFVAFRWEGCHMAPQRPQSPLLTTPRGSFPLDAFQVHTSIYTHVRIRVHGYAARSCSLTKSITHPLHQPTPSPLQRLLIRGVTLQVDYRGVQTRVGTNLDSQSGIHRGSQP